MSAIAKNSGKDWWISGERMFWRPCIFRGRYLSNYSTDSIKTKFIRKIELELYIKVSLKIQSDT